MLKHETAAAKAAIDRAVLMDAALTAPADMLKPLVLGKLIEGASDLHKIPAFDYPEVNLLAAGYAQVNADKSGIVSLGFLTGSTLPYRAQDVGQVTLVARTLPGRFANASAEASHRVRVNASHAISMSPGQSRVSPGAKVRLYIVWRSPDEFALEHFRVSFDSNQKAHHYQLSPSASEVVINGRPQLAYTLDVQTLARPELFPITVSAALLDTPGVSATSVIEAAAITPDPGCVEPGQTIAFAVGANGSGTAGVSWSMTRGPGTISPDGTYLAPASPGRRVPVTVTANLPGGGSLAREFTLNCGCFWSLSAAGKRWTGSNVSIMAVQDPGNGPSHLVATHDGGDVQVSLTSPNAISTGTRAATLFGSIDTLALATVCDGDEDDDGHCDPQRSPQDPPQPPPASYVIDKVGDGFVQGKLAGTAVLLSELRDGGSLPTTEVEFRFRAPQASGDTDPSLALANSLAAGAGATDDATLEAFGQLNALMGLTGCDAEAD